MTVQHSAVIIKILLTNVGGLCSGAVHLSCLFVCCLKDIHKNKHSSAVVFIDDH